MSNLTTEQLSLYDLTLQSIQRDVNRLNDTGTDRVSKRRALESIDKVIFGSKKDDAVYVALFEALGETLLSMSVDSVEKCRELSVKIIANFIKFEKESPVQHKLRVLKVAKERLTEENIESVEEIRLEWIEVCGEVIKQGGYEHDVVNILVEIFQASLQDVFPELKKRSIQLVTELGRIAGKDLRLQAQPLVKALIPSLTHRHSSIRISSLRALEVLVELDMASLDLILEHLHKLVFDKSASVRQELYTVVKHWIHQSIQDTSSFKILPIVFAGMSDEVGDLQTLCRQYLTDLEKWYGDSDKSTGSLAQNSIEYALPMILEDTQHWCTTDRVLALKVLDTLIEHAGKAIEVHTAKILQSLYMQAQHKDSSVVSQGIKCAVTLGKYVHPSIYAHLTVQQINMASQETRPNLLMVLESCIRGSSCSELLGIVPWLVETLCHRKFIQEECVQSSVDIAYNLVTKMSEGGITLTKCPEGYQLLHFLLILEDDRKGADKIPAAISALSAMHGFANPSELVAEYFDDLLEKLKRSESKWNTDSEQFRMFCRLLVESGEFIEPHLDQVLSSLKTLTDIKRDSELRVRIFQTLNSVFQHTSIKDQHAVSLVFEIILPNLEYHPPQKTPTVRAAAMESLYVLLRSNRSSTSLDPKQSNQLVMILCQSLEDEIPGTRLRSLKLLEETTKCFCPQMADDRLIIAMYPEILKRLDDAQDEVRNEAVISVSRLLDAVSPNFEGSHVENILRTLMLQLNDDNAQYQAEQSSFQALASLPNHTGSFVSDLEGNLISSTGDLGKPDEVKTINKLLQDVSSLLSKSDESELQKVTVHGLDHNISMTINSDHVYAVKQSH
ncbi:ARM repeat-containing protein [Basidiobolus meristosporus CBS 931.73]|uniref:ARM repeat-containing protein n=1 Tax=Basidiobolus meristosporus CBS 931.73 TaxID=1314790 RepID=A0A1Y1YDE8_9FUNG|nr:ARM repeat-containing protein [Basidiobolus meristosporus CBS 931.73]|eukprot:ORX96009.1 ARM repeat-containing protein [Basidiobolus meristosporus CBS 931.73]